MKIGIYLRNSGPLASPDLLAACAQAAETHSVDDLWVYDHLAIPPDQSEGSDGIYVEALSTLAFLAGVTERIGLGTGILVLSYRPALLTAKSIASVQALSRGRMRLGAGVGWMEAEFRALGISRTRRGALADEALELLHRCFAADEVEVNGQRFLFLPRPERPPIYVGGNGPHALRRAALLADGWFPMNMDADALRAPIEELRRLASDAGRPVPDIVAGGQLPLDDTVLARDRLRALADVGVTRIALRAPYTTVDDFERVAEAAVRLRDAA